MKIYLYLLLLYKSRINLEFKTIFDRDNLVDQLTNDYGEF